MAGLAWRFQEVHTLDGAFSKALMKHISWTVRGVGILAWYFVFLSYFLFHFVPASRQKQGQRGQMFMGISGLIAYNIRQHICNRGKDHSDSSGANRPFD